MDQTQLSRDNTNTSRDNHNPSASTEEAPPQAKTQHRICGHPLYKRHSRKFKNICGKYGIQVFFKCNTTIKQILMKLKNQNPRTKRVGSYTVTSLGILPAARSTQGKHQEPLVKDTGSTRKNLLPSMHTSNKLDILQQVTTSTLLGGRTRGWPGP